MILEGSFREDLYYRLKVVLIRLPPLADRVEDIPLLVQHFLSEIAKERGTKPLQIRSETMHLFLNYSWPGNIRELENEVQRLVIMGEKDFRPGTTTSVRRYQRPGLSIPPGLGLEDTIENFERQVIRNALEENDWNKSRTAKCLSIGRMKLHRKMEKLGLERPTKE